MGAQVAAEEKEIVNGYRIADIQMRFLKIGLITGFGLGYMPVAPATFGCLLSVIIWYFFVNFPILYITIFVNLFLWGLLICNEFVSEWGRDPRKIVIDEYACLLLPLFFVPKRILPLLITFVIFRLLDILKPPPLKKFESLPGSLGIMLDDLGAAIYTTVVVIIAFVIFKLF